MDSTQTTPLLPQSTTVDSRPRNLPARQMDSTPVRPVVPQSNSVDPAARNPSTMADPTLKSNQTYSMPISMSSAEPPSMRSGAPSDGKIVQSEVEEKQKRLKINYYETKMETSLVLFLRIQMVYLCFLMVIIFTLVQVTHPKCLKMAPFVIGLMTLYPFIGFPALIEINHLYSLRSLRAALLSGEKAPDCKDWYDHKYRFELYFIGHCTLVALNGVALIACLPLLKEACF